MNHEPLLPLGRAWLDELRALGIITDETSAQARAKLIPRANKAAREVLAEYDELAKAGELKALTREYKRLREEAWSKGKNPIPWWRFLHENKQRMIRSLARREATRHRWVPIRDMKKDA